MNRPLTTFFFSLIAAGLSVLILLLLIGESPSVFFEAFYHTLFTPFGLGYTLYHATPLMLTGLSVALCFHCGLFNIGAEGQLYWGSMGIVLASYYVHPSTPWIAIPFGFLVCILAGGIWGGIAGFLKATRGAHEVLVTILLNFIALSTIDYLTVRAFHNPELQNAETIPIPSAFHLPPASALLPAFSGTPLNVAFLIAILCCIGVHVFLFYTSTGFEMRATGKNASASQHVGIRVARSGTLAFFMSGSLAGLVGVNEVMGHAHRVIDGFSPGYGFSGIAVSLVARNHPLWIPFSAILFGALHNSSRELEFLSDKVSKEFSLVIQGTLIFITLLNLPEVRHWWRFFRRSEA